MRKITVFFLCLLLLAASAAKPNRAIEAKDAGATPAER